MSCAEPSPLCWSVLAANQQRKRTASAGGPPRLDASVVRSRWALRSEGRRSNLDAESWNCACPPIAPPATFRACGCGVSFLHHHRHHIIISSFHHLAFVATFAQASESNPQARARLGHHGWMAEDFGKAAARTACDAAPEATETSRRQGSASQWCNERGVVGGGAAATLDAESPCSA